MGRSANIGFGFLAVVACVAAYFAGTTWFKPSPALAPAAPAAETPALVIEPASLRLGEIWESVGHVVRLDVRNTTPNRVTIQRFVSGCYCSDVSPSTLTIEPNSSAPVTVTINTTHRLPHQRGLAKWPLSVSITAVVDQSDVRGHNWEVTGTVKAWASLETPWLDFDDRCQHTGSPSTRMVRVKRHAAFDRLKAIIEPAKATVVVTPVTGSTDELDVVVTPNPALPIGPFSFDVRLEAVEANGTRHPVSLLTIRGDMQPPVRIVPRVVLLGEHKVGTEATGEVELRLPTADGWAVKQIEPGSADVRVVVLPSSSPGVLRYSATQRIATAGDQRADIQFVLTRPDGKTLRVKTEVVSYGLQTPAPK